MRLSASRYLFRRRFSQSVEVLKRKGTKKELFEASDDEVLSKITAAFKVEENIVSVDEEQRLLNEIEPHFRRLRYERDHWDGAIVGYREVERNRWSVENHQLMDRIRERFFAAGSRHLPMVHCLDVAKEGEIKPHIDAVRFCGHTLAGLSLMSTAVMRLALENHPERWVKILLPQRSIYVMSGTARYDFTHAILSENESFFRGEKIPRERRISVMFRIEPSDDVS